MKLCSVKIHQATLVSVFGKYLSFQERQTERHPCFLFHPTTHSLSQSLQDIKT